VIDRRTVVICLTLIALMLVAAACRIIMLEDWTVLSVQHRAVPFWLFFVWPAASAFVVGVLVLEQPSSADIARLQPWRTWGAFVSISYCALLLLFQAVLILMSVNIGMHLYHRAIARALGVLMGIMIIVAVNQKPKLPYFERRFAPGGDLGPIYGPRYERTGSRIAIVFMVAVIAFSVAAPSMGSPPALFILVVLLAAAFLLVWIIAWRRHLGRKWRLEQLAAR
jgi:hypothetical protein